MDGLDQAALRRFDLKVKFDFLSPNQAAALLHRHCEMLVLPVPNEEDLRAIRHLRRLTPGDYAAVLRQHRLRPIMSAERWITMLEAECTLKKGSRAAVGFLA
jgi:hypothetical protein